MISVREGSKGEQESKLAMQVNERADEQVVHCFPFACSFRPPCFVLSGDSGSTVGLSRAAFLDLPASDASRDVSLDS